MAKASKKTNEAGVRDRLLDAADRLFYTEGVRAIGIDRVLSEAEAAKASLYSHFGCKDELVAAYLERRLAEGRARMDAFTASVPPEERALRIFDWVVEWVSSPEFRGCPMQHVVSEIADPAHSARIVAASHREWLSARFTEWSKAAGVSNPSRVAGALMVLFDGAVSASEQDGVRRAKDARWAAKALLER